MSPGTALEMLKFASRNKCLTSSNKKLLGTRNKCIASSNKCLTSSNKKLLGAPGIATRSKDATRGSWPY